MNLPGQNNPEQLELKKSDLLRSGWSFDARKNAFERLSSTGFPTSRDEYWKYTNPVTLTKKNSR
jgi:Fe-S cluster assembly protein SufD